MKQLTAIVLLTCLLAACQGIPFIVKRLDQEDRQAVTLEQCADYFRDQDEVLRERIIAAGLIDEEHWGAVDARQIVGGMNVCAMHAAWGDDYEAAEYTSVLGTTTQYIYDRKGYRDAHVHVKEGMVTSWSSLDRANTEPGKRLFGFIPLPRL